MVYIHGIAGIVVSRVDLSPTARYPVGKEAENTSDMAVQMKKHSFFLSGKKVVDEGHPEVRSFLKAMPYPAYEPDEESDGDLLVRRGQEDKLAGDDIAKVITPITMRISVQKSLQNDENFLGHIGHSICRKDKEKSPFSEGEEKAPAGTRGEGTSPRKSHLLPLTS